VALVNEPEGHRDEYFVRRLEAFGDIVIGFSLALLALSLIVPDHARSLLEHRTWLIAYVWTFALICSMWGSHYWTFRYVFTPTRVAVVLNYVKLALIVLLIFAVQVLLKALAAGDPRDVAVANEFYWGCLCAYWLVAGLLLAEGLRARKKYLAPEIVARCQNRLWRLAVIVPVLVAGILIGSRYDADQMASTVATFMVAGVVIGAAAGRIAARYGGRTK